MQQFYIEAKKRVAAIVNAFENLGRKHKKARLSKYGKNSIKIMKDFLKCNITSSAITEKYNAVSNLLEEYSNANRTFDAKN